MHVLFYDRRLFPFLRHFLFFFLFKFLYQLLLPSVLRDIHNACQHIAVLGTKSSQFWQSRHFDRVFLADDFTQNSDWSSSRQYRKIHRRFSMSITLQNTAFPCSQRENVTRTSEISRLRLHIGQELTCPGSIGGTNSSRNS
jgi:hypothetical protein